ncbi:unnamed protein product, partial [Laminaria digitata]
YDGSLASLKTVVFSSSPKVRKSKPCPPSGTGLLREVKPAPAQWMTAQQLDDILGSTAGWKNKGMGGVGGGSGGGRGSGSGSREKEEEEVVEVEEWKVEDVPAEVCGNARFAAELFQLAKAERHASLLFKRAYINSLED